MQDTSNVSTLEPKCPKGEVEILRKANVDLSAKNTTAKAKAKADKELIAAKGETIRILEAQLNSTKGNAGDKGVDAMRVAKALDTAATLTDVCESDSMPLKWVSRIVDALKADHTLAIEAK